MRRRCKYQPLISGDDLVVFDTGIIWYVDMLRESGVFFMIFRDAATEDVGACVAMLERGLPMSKNGKVRGQALGSIADRLLAARKEVQASAHLAHDEEWAATVPNVHELLTRRLEDGKKVIEPASILFFAKGGSWHAMLNHRGLDVRWWGEGPTIKHALDALERACGKEDGSGPVNGLSANMGQS